MALTQKDILLISEEVEKMYMDCASQLIINISRHFADGNELAVQDWETKKLSELGALTDESIEIIAANTGNASHVIKKAIAKGMDMELSSVETMLKKATEGGMIQGVGGSWQASEGVKTVLTNLTEQALNDANIVNTVMLESTRERYINAVQFAAREELRLIEQLQSSRGLQALEQQLVKTQQAINSATFSVAIGAESRQAALRRTIAKLAKEGITGYIDAAGHHWSPEAYINMDIRTTVHNAAIQGQKARSADYGVSTFQISSHAGARPLCAPYQGRFYSWDGSSGTVTDLNGRKYKYEGINKTSYGRAAGIFGINCGHRPLTFVSGYSLARYEPTENAEENDLLYQLTQQQRHMERKIRSDKTLALAYDAAGDKDEFIKTAMKIKAETAEYNKFCSDNDLTRRTDRTQVYGYNRKISGKVKAVR